MLTIVAKRVQSRLSRKGVKVELKDIITHLENTVSNVNKITKQETNQATDYFMSTATKLTVIGEDVEPATTNEAATELETLTNNNSDEIEPETTTNPSTIEELEEFYTHPALFTPKTENEEIPQSSELATTTKNELVSSTAQGLGVVLNEDEIELIATNVNCSSDDLQETLEEIKGAIIAFIQHRIANNSQKIDETLQEIVQVATDGFNANSQQLTDGLRNINQQLQQQSKDFKSKVKSTLKCFQLPEAS
ncbi:hypothetical protein H6G06_26145 [Anabaena sphaerica FACHB-251]|uniref:Uncharacterized protein n=1 Tax=Anabaena sphaerica FACHB-251 TaxID=2692883 RepID=A0A926WLR8_9NOST|nr:hypothetical protein [Anabaena sphaerica]MBD2296862.1 hypothetical protein [Anabaena sphaerica FACHB-251]